MMKPYDRLTIVRNRHRVGELRRFRELVESYFEGSEYATDNLPVDWEGARRARSFINQMLPRVMQIVHAARLDAPAAGVGGAGPPVADVKVLRNIFNARYTDGAEQEILDVIDMAIGVYDATRFNALVRTVNPFHYTFSALAYIGRIPGRVVATIFHKAERARAPSLREEDVTRLDAVVSRISDVEDLIEARFAEMRDRQMQQYGENAEQLVDLAERLDFAERLLAQQRPAGHLKPRNENDVATPV